MIDNGIFQRVRRVAADIFDVVEEQVTAESSPATVENWDSLQHLNFVLSLEGEFGIRLSPVEAGDILTVGTAAQIITEKISSR